ncbi:RILP-like protein 1 [Lamellibrachia satsuma]|nr:RILP-like protein 1 [Lamellibrachia satsuma]
MEDAWQKEANEFRESIFKLGEENRKLRKAVSEVTGIEASKRKEEEDEEKEQQYVLINELKETAQKQREQLRSLQRENRQSNIDMEALQSEVQRLVQLNASCRRKTTVTRLQADHLMADKAELQSQLTEKENQILHISHLLKDQDTDPSPPPPATPGDNMEKLEERLSLEGKMVVDLTDPNRPRFTLSELRDVLQERNELKTKLLEVEEELHQYKPEAAAGKEEGGEGDVAEAEEEKRICDYDIPVQGPINKEPRDKLCPEESLIRRLVTFMRSPRRQQRSKARSKHSVPLREM